MKWHSLLGCGLLVASAFGAVGCAGRLDQSSEPAVVLGEQAELVARKREWLGKYDSDCEVCFKAFEMCQRGAVDGAEQQACQTALDACVRGGMAGDGDDGDDGDDGGGAEVDDGPSDGSGTQDGDDADAGSDAGSDVDDADAGATDEPADGDDGDANADPGGAGGAQDDDDDVTGGDPGKKALLDDIRACVGALRDCAGNAPDRSERRACVGSLRACVKDALSQAFEGVCEVQIQSCLHNGVAEAVLESVKDQCEQGLPRP